MSRHSAVFNALDHSPGGPAPAAGFSPGSSSFQPRRNAGPSNHAGVRNGRWHRRCSTPSERRPRLTDESSPGRGRVAGLGVDDVCGPRPMPVLEHFLQHRKRASRATLPSKPERSHRFSTPVTMTAVEHRCFSQLGRFYYPGNAERGSLVQVRSQHLHPDRQTTTGRSTWNGDPANPRKTCCNRINISKIHR